jgi:PKD repeat protein
VAENVPVPDAGGPYSGAEGTSINLIGSSTAPNGGPLNYAWDLDQDGQFDDAFSASTIFSASEPGIYTVTLKVTDNGVPAIDSAQVTVTNLAPSAEAGGPYNGTAELSINLSGSGTDPGGGSLNYAWDLDSDGQFDDAMSATTTFTWSVSGTYTVALRVSDAQGLTSTDTAQVVVDPKTQNGSSYNIFLPIILR